MKAGGEPSVTGAGRGQAGGEVVFDADTIGATAAELEYARKAQLHDLVAADLESFRDPLQADPRAISISEMKSHEAVSGVDIAINRAATGLNNITKWFRDNL